MPKNKPIAEETVEGKHLILSRISKIVDKLVEDDEVFKKIDKSRMMKSLSTLVEESPHELISITNDEFTQRIEKVMLVEAVSGMLNDLSLEQMKSFEEAVRRRRFFK